MEVTNERKIIPREVFSKHWFYNYRFDFGRVCCLQFLLLRTYDRR